MGTKLVTNNATSYPRLPKWEFNIVIHCSTNPRLNVGVTHTLCVLLYILHCFMFLLSNALMLPESPWVFERGPVWAMWLFCTGSEGPITWIFMKYEVSHVWKILIEFLCDIALSLPLVGRKATEATSRMVFNCTVTPRPAVINYCYFAIPLLLVASSLSVVMPLLLIAMPLLLSLIVRCPHDCMPWIPKLLLFTASRGSGVILQSPRVERGKRQSGL